MELPNFTNREYALAIWLGIAIVLMLSQKNIRDTIFAMFRTILHRKILLPLFILIAYIVFVVFLFFKLHLWEMGMVKETLYWFFGTAVVMFVNVNNAGNDAQFFRKKLLSNLEFMVIFGFIINLYTFSLPAEIVLMPFLFLLFGMIAVAEIDKKHAPIKRILAFFLSAVGIFFLFYAVSMAILDFGNFFSIATLKDFLLHPMLTILVLPFIYFLALYSIYDGLFMRIDLFVKKKIQRQQPS